MDCEVVHDDPYDLMAVRVPADDTLELVIGYAMGCSDHTFYACWDGEFLENDPAVFNEANPPRARVSLGHDAHGETCEAGEVLTLDFWLTPVREAYAATHDNGATRLVIEIGDQSVQYPFPE